MKTLFFLTLLFYFADVHAGKVSGWVRDDKGKPMPFATILVKNTPFGATSNSEGFYSISLEPGNYDIECRYVGYATLGKSIRVGKEDMEVNFTLEMQSLELQEIIINSNAEDPAYDIIRKAIRQRPYYKNQVQSFSAEVYVKGMVKLLKLPDRIMGSKIEDKDRREMGLDSSGQGIIYLSESLTRVFEQKPDKIKMEVVSSRVSGSDGFGFDFPIFISFYDNIVNVSKGAFSKRGFISPIADNALNFYNYKFLGSFFENGKQINSIRVIPKRSYEPLFSGIINIVENDWRIFSCRLFLTKTAQLQILDSLEISQIYSPQIRDIWRIKNQVIHFHINQFGVSVGGDFVNVYSKYNLDPKFSKTFFDKVVIKYDTAANKRSDSYWDTLRPVPLEVEEVRDFQKKDSIKLIRDSTAYNRDSLRKLQSSLKLKELLLFDVNRKIFGKKSATSLYIEGLLKGIQYNTVEGVSVNPSAVLSKYFSKINTTIRFIGDVRYGFSNRHLNPWAGLVFTDRLNPKGQHKFRNYEYFIAGGKRISQFYKMSTLTGIVNSVSTLLYGWNDMKLYENYFFKTGFKKSWDSGTGFVIEGEYENRKPIENSTDFLFNEKWKKRLTPNYPVEVLNGQFTAHKAVVLHGSFRFQPGQRYIQYPNAKYSLGSDFPVFMVDYYKGIPGIFGGEEDFDRWQVEVSDVLGLRMVGRLKYLVGMGGFLNTEKVFVQDYKHFSGTNSHVSYEYVRSFQDKTMYQYSNKSPFYTELHIEHHWDGAVSNKIPFLKKWNWYLLEGANALYLSPNVHHLELFVGLENILKMFRVDVLMRMQDGYKPAFSYRIGFGGLLGDAANIVRFKRNDKIINPW